MYCHDCAAPVPMDLSEYAQKLDADGAVHCPHCRRHHISTAKSSSELLQRLYS